MLNLRKKTLALAVAAAATLVGGISVAQAQAVSADGYGEVALYPYFTVRDGWRTFIHVTNTSARTVAAKVRFHAAKGSEDILDFLVVLSPYDMWTAVVEERDGKPGVRPTDNSCTVPAIGSGTFKAFITSRVDTADDAREGYAEIIEMGTPADETNSIAVAAKHDSSGVPADCGVVVSAFGSANIATTRTVFNQPPDNELIGKFDLINTGRAYAGASRAVMISDFTTAAIVYGQFSGEWDYPTLDSGTGGVANVNTALGATSISNEWVLNPGINELSSWVLTFPTKSLTIEAAEGTPTPFEGSEDCSNDDYQDNAVPVAISLYNREEKGQDVDFSPGTGSALCYETNVVNFVDDGISSSGLLKSVVSNIVDTSVLDSPFLGGWASVAYSGTTTGAVTLPAIGFNLTARSNADGDSAVLYDHVYADRP